MKRRSFLAGLVGAFVAPVLARVLPPPAEAPLVSGEIGTFQGVDFVMHDSGGLLNLRALYEAEFGRAFAKKIDADMYACIVERSTAEDLRA